MSSDNKSHVDCGNDPDKNPPPTVQYVTVTQAEHHATGVQTLAPPRYHVPNYLCLSFIIAGITGNPFIGIPAIVYATKANARRSTNPALARKNALIARNLILATCIMSVAGAICFTCLMLSQRNSA